MYTLKYSIKLPLTLDKCWDFFSTPQNLKVLTPENMGFKIFTEGSAEMIYPGKIIGYIIRPFWNIPMKWVTEITHVHEPHYFIDEQRIGPYKLWHHEHHFTPIKNGVEMHDIVYYEMPFGLIGRALHTLKFQNDLENIFSYRQEKLSRLFGEYVNRG